MNLLDTIFPKKCLECKKTGNYICWNCLNKLIPLKQVCIRCGKPSIDGLTHTKCLRPWGMDGLVHLWPYGGVIRKALLGLKYKYATDIAREITKNIVIKLKTKDILFPKTVVLVPIPLHARRKNWRGFNQVEVIGRGVSEKMDWKLNSELLVREKLRRPQIELRGKQRRQNIRGVFSVKKNHLTIQPFNHLTVVLFDDVFTTGSTIKEACKVLKRNRVKKVWGLTIAR